MYGFIYILNCCGIATVGRKKAAWCSFPLNLTSSGGREETRNTYDSVYANLRYVG